MTALAEHSCACKHQGCLHLRWCREGILLSSAAFHSLQDPGHILHWVESGGSQWSPFIPFPLGSHPLDVFLAATMSSGWQKVYGPGATEGNDFFTYPKASLLYMLLYRVRRDAYSLDEKIHLVWFHGFFLEL